MKKTTNWFKYSYLIMILFFLYIPILTIIVFSFWGKIDATQSWWNFNNFKELFKKESLIRSFFVTIFVAFVSSSCSTMLAVFASIGVSKLKKNYKTMIMSISKIPILNFDIITAIFLTLTLLMFGFKLGITTLILSHILVCTPYVILIIYPKIRLLKREIIESSLDLGATYFKTIIKVVIPSIKSSIITGFFISFVISFDDFTISYFTGGTYHNLSTFMNTIREYQLWMNACVSLVVLTLLLGIVGCNLYFFVFKTKKYKKYYINWLAKIKRINNYVNISDKLFYFKSLIKKVKSIVLVIIIIGGCVLFNMNFVSNNKIKLLAWGSYVSDKVVKDQNIELNQMDSNEYAVIKLKTTDYDIINSMYPIIDNVLIEAKLIQPIDWEGIGKHFEDTTWKQQHNSDKTNVFKNWFWQNKIHKKFQKALTNEKMNYGVPYFANFYPLVINEKENPLAYAKALKKIKDKNPSLIDKDETFKNLEILNHFINDNIGGKNGDKQMQIWLNKDTRNLLMLGSLVKTGKHEPTNSEELKEALKWVKNLLIKSNVHINSDYIRERFKNNKFDVGFSYNGDFVNGYNKDYKWKVISVQESIADIDFLCVAKNVNNIKKEQLNKFFAYILSDKIQAHLQDTFNYTSLNNKIKITNNDETLPKIMYPWSANKLLSMPQKYLDEAILAIKA